MGGVQNAQAAPQVGVILSACLLAMTASAVQPYFDVDFPNGVDQGFIGCGRWIESSGRSNGCGSLERIGP
jgi:hypothetical protein